MENVYFIWYWYISCDSFDLWYENHSGNMESLVDQVNVAVICSKLIRHISREEFSLENVEKTFLSSSTVWITV